MANPKPYQMDWNDPANINRLTGYVRQGMGVTAMAVAFGCTRNSIIGIAHRKWGSVGQMRSKICGLTLEDRAEAEAIHDAELAESARAEEDARLKYEAFRNRQKGDRSCASPGCRNTKQYNAYDLCSQCDQERINDKHRAYPRVRSNMRSVAV